MDEECADSNSEAFLARGRFVLALMLHLSYCVVGL